MSPDTTPQPRPRWTSQHLLEAVAAHYASAPADPADPAAVEPLTEVRLARLSGLGERQVEHAVRVLRQHGYLARDDASGGHALTPEGARALEEGRRLTSGPPGPLGGSAARRRGNSLYQRAWNVLRQGRKVSIPDILLLAARGDEKDPEGNLGRYLRALAAAGYLRRLPRREAPTCGCGGPGRIRWHLVSDTGPHAPALRRRGPVSELWDHNLEVTIACARDLVPVPARGVAP